jgi:two-component system, OmpR family, response regulator
MKEQNNQYIFLVDDEPIQNEMLKDYLSERFQYNIKMFNNGDAAIKDLELHPEIVILDFHLDDNEHIKDGLEVLKKMKELKPQLKVIMLSGQDKLDVAVDCMRYGAYDYVTKGETAFSRIENILNNISELQASKTLNKLYKNIILFLGVMVLGILAITLLFLRKL